MQGVNPNAVRTVNPSSYPQYPFDESPCTPERSEPRYAIQADTDQRVTMRDGARLAVDVYRPLAAGEKFPALCAFSPYSRQLQQTLAPYGQNEAGLTEFWVPRGYVHVIVDVRGSNESDGSWEMSGPNEQADMAEVIQWAAEQPWCNGKVGMVGCSYFAATQLLAAEQHPPALRAIFPYDARTDLYRDAYYRGGIPNDGFARAWFHCVNALNIGSGRLRDTSGVRDFFRTVLGDEQPLDGEFWRSKSSYYRLPEIDIPAYFGCDWDFWGLHLRGAFSGWERCRQAPNRMLLGPPPFPNRPFGAYHQEALRWYDHYLKGLDSGVLEGPPIQLWIQGENHWRGEREWPLARTEWRELYLGGSADGLEGELLDRPGRPGEHSYTFDPASHEALWGRPRLTYRAPPFDVNFELTGPLQLTLNLASTATDTDMLVTVGDEAPGGGLKVLTRGWLRASHRTVDPDLSKPYQPWHPHTNPEPLTPGQPTELLVEILPTSNCFKPGHRLRLDIASSDSLPENMSWYARAQHRPATNTVLEGGASPSRLLVPVIPR